VANPGMSSLSADHTSAAGSQFAFTRSIFTVLCRFLNDEDSVNDRNPSACCEGQVLVRQESLVAWNRLAELGVKWRKEPGG
jgi:hypothetical protein